MKILINAKILYAFVTISAILSSFVLVGMEDVQEQLVKQYPLPPYVSSLIDVWTNYGKFSVLKNCPQVGTTHSIRRITSWNPDDAFYLKRNTTRFEGAERLNKVIQHKKLTIPFVTPQYAYYNPIDKTVWIVSQEVNNFVKKPFNLPQIMQVYTLFKHSYFTDVHEDNIRNCDDGTVCFFDTEISGFLEEWQRILSFYRLYYLPMTEDARKFLATKILKEENKYTNQPWFDKIKKGRPYALANQTGENGYLFSHQC